MRECGGNQVFEQGVGGQKIWRLDENAAFGVGDGLVEHKGDVAPLRSGAGCEQLCGHPAGEGRGKRYAVRNQRASHEMPVDREGILQGRHHGPFDADMRVAPGGEFAAGDVAVGDVHAAQVAYAAVDDTYLAVVAPVDACAELREGDLEKGIHLHSGFAHAFEKAVFDRERADMVVYYPDCQAVTGAVDEYPGNLVSDSVVFEYIVFYIYIMCSRGEVAFQCGEFVGTVCENVHAVSGIEGGVGERMAELNLLAALGGDVGEFRGQGVLALAFFEPTAVAARHLACVLDVTSENDI